MAVYNGPISLIKLFPNSNLNSASKSLINNVAGSALNFGVNKVLGQELSQKLGFTPAGDSNFLSTIVGPGLISTGVEGLSQIVTNSITNSKALGPLGPLAGGLVNAGIDALGNQLTNSLFGNPKGALNTKGTPNVYFPGAGGAGEAEANFASGGGGLGGLLGTALGTGSKKKQPYSIGNGGVDVVFSIISAADAQAAQQAKEQTRAKADPNAPPAPAPGAPTPAAGAANSNIPDQPAQSAQPVSPTQAVSGAPAVAAAPAANPPPGARVIPAGVAGGISGGTLTIRPIPGGAGAEVIGQTGVPTTTEAIQATAEANTGTQPAGTDTGQPKPETAAPATSPEPEKAPPSIAESAPGWKFICPPEDISWETTFQADRIPIFGMNDAPVIGGSKSMRELTLSNAIVEGFTRGKTIEDKIILLENMMRMKMGKTQDNSNYVQIPVYKVFANDKIYGNGNTPYEKGFFIIKSVKVQEKMRDLAGKTTRALVDISLTQVPSYQVESGRDIASAFLPSQRFPLNTVVDRVLANTPEIIKGINAASAASRGVNGQANGGQGEGQGQGGASAPVPAADPLASGGPGRMVEVRYP